MHIHKEQAESHSIQSYSDSEIRINGIVYTKSLIQSRTETITNWDIHSIEELNERLLKPILELQPEVIIIGHSETGKLTPLPMIAYLSQHKIGIECMSIGAACRTFNVLLSEDRSVVAGFIL